MGGGPNDQGEQLLGDSLLGARVYVCFFFSSRRRHTRSKRDWSSDVCSSDLELERNRDLLLDLLRRVPRKKRDDRRLDVADVGKCLHGQRPERGDPPGNEERDNQPEKERLIEGKQIGRASCRERVST